VALVVLSCWLVVLVACSPGSGPTETPAAVELESSAPTPTLEEGVRMIPVETPKGTFQVWAKRVGDNPTMKVLLLHGGPGVGHEYLEPLAELLPEAGIEVPTLVIGARHDTMDPEHIRWMAEQLPNGSYLFCPDGSHLAFYDDQQVYMKGVIRFIREVDGQKSTS
jgi:pimeloyl-ACP methyl ester carboxylesterase